MVQDIGEKTVVITGATSGIGLATATELAGRGAYVIGVGRDKQRCSHAKEHIAATTGARTDFLTADLRMQKNVRQLAEDIQALLMEHGEKNLDLLINNAGMISAWYTLTDEGLETQFAVNHLAPFLLTHLLMPILLKSSEPRVLTVSSKSHRGTRIRFDDIMLKKSYSCLGAYKHTKLCNVMFMAELQRRFGNGNLRAFAVDPGLVRTEIGMKGTGGLVSFVWSMRARGGITPEQGASTCIHLASHEGPGEGIYWKDCAPIPSSGYSRRVAEAKQLWELSEKMCAIPPGGFGKTD
jgi:NAD(P)-dependent dehydrogenase (short-subunit alcohol dehydrogenase family)